MAPVRDKTLYDGKFFIEPPRAETAIPYDLLTHYEKQGWWSQLKKNGTNSVIAVGPDGMIKTWNRRGDPHKAWAITPESARVFSNGFPPTAEPGNGWYVFNAELLHSKGIGIKDTHFIHDVLVSDGHWLLGWTYAQRYAELQRLLMRGQGEFKLGCQWLDPNACLARNIRSDFTKVFLGLDPNQDEGLMLKDPTGRLKATSFAHWMIRCRFPTKSLPF